MPEQINKKLDIEQKLEQLVVEDDDVDDDTKSPFSKIMAKSSVLEFSVKEIANMHRKNSDVDDNNYG